MNVPTNSLFEKSVRACMRNKLFKKEEQCRTFVAKVYPDAQRYGIREPKESQLSEKRKGEVFKPITVAEVPGIGAGLSEELLNHGYGSLTSIVKSSGGEAKFFDLRIKGLGLKRKMLLWMYAQKHVRGVDVSEDEFVAYLQEMHGKMRKRK